MELSPVIQAFLAGQQGQSSLLSQADESKDRAAQRKLQRQQIDEVVKQHLAEAQQHADRMTLDTKRAELERQSHVADYMQRFKAGLADGTIPKQSQALAGSVNIPGMPMAAPPMDTAYGDTPNVQGMAPGIQIPGMSTSMVSPTQTTASPYGGNITVGTPRDAGEAKIADAVNMANALRPGLLQTEQAKSDIGSEAANKLYENVKAPLAAQKAAADLTKATAMGEFHVEAANRRAFEASMRSDLARLQHESDLTGGLTEQALQSKIQSVVPQALIGNYDIGKEPFAKVKGKLRDAVLAVGGSPDVPQKTFTDVYQKAATAIDLKNSIDALNSQVTKPQNFIGRAAAAISGGVGYKGLGVDKQTFDEFTAKIAPLAEIASGVSPGAMRSVALLQMFKSLIHQPGDSSTNIAIKDRLATGIPLAAMAKDLAGVPPSQAAAIYTEAIRRNPDILKSSPEAAEELLKAAKTGQYVPSKALNKFLGDLKNAK